MITGITGALRAVCNVAKALHHAACAASFLAILTILPGCYAGLAAVVLVAIDAGGAGSAGSGAGNAPAVLSGVTLTRTQRSPAEISFILTDPEADPVDVEISYARGAGGTEFPVLLTGTDRSLRGLATSKGGTRHSRLWDFESQLGAGLADGFTVTVTITGGPSVSASDLSLGNDPPRVFDLRLPAAREAVGIVNVVFKVADSSEDLRSWPSPESRRNGEAPSWTSTGTWSPTWEARSSTCRSGSPPWTPWRKEF